jgi:hypothetical protein
MLLSYLHRLPDLAILAVIVLSITGLAMLAPFIGRHVIRLPDSAGRDEAAFEGFKAVMSMTGVVLAFSLVQVNGNLQSIEGRVAKEGATLLTIDRALQRIGLPEADALRPTLNDFAKKQTQLEWPLLAKEQRSPQVDAAYSVLSRAARSINPTDKLQETVFSELLKSLDDLSDNREAILADASIRLPEFFWITSIGLLLVSLSLGVLMKSTVTRIVSVGATSAAVGLLLGFVVIVDEPFAGDTSVSPKPILTAVALNQRRS